MPFGAFRRGGLVERGRVVDDRSGWCWDLFPVFCALFRDQELVAEVERHWIDERLAKGPYSITISSAMAAVAEHPGRRRRRGSSLLLIFLGIGIGFYAGRQICVMQITASPNAAQPFAPVSETVLGTPPRSVQVDNTGSVFTLHRRLAVKEDQSLFDSEFRPKLDSLLSEVDAGTSSLNECKNTDLEPYLGILRNIHSNPRYYEQNDEKKYDWKCPLVLLFYYESGTKTLFDRWVQYYSRIEQKQCIKAIAPKRYRNSSDIHKMIDSGYELIGPGWPVKQDKVINIALDAIQKDDAYYGEDTLVSINDLDHLMVYFGADGKPYRYSSYSDMVALYVYELLSTGIGNTRSCGNQMMAEKFAVPCTCLIEDNARYISLEGDDVLFSEYGKTNKFHSTANFYLRNGRPSGTNLGEWRTGTVYANLRGFDQDAITHHKIAYKSKEEKKEAASHAGVLHFRSDGYMSTTTKYMHFLLSNGLFSSDRATVEDVLICASADTFRLFKENKLCRAVKEIANIISQVHQKRLCLDAGYSEEHCSNELTCCLTEPGWTSS